MKKYLLVVFLFFGFLTGTAQVVQKIKISYQKMGDGLYDFYAENPNHVPLQLSLSFTEFENMAASCSLPFITTIQPGKQLLFEIRRVFIDLPGSFKYTYSTRVGAYPVTPDRAAVYQLPVAKGKLTKAIYFDFSQSTSPNKMVWGFEMEKYDTIMACRDGIVCLKTESGMRDSLKVGENKITILHPDNTFGRYDQFAEKSFFVELGDTIKAGNPLGIVAGINPLFPHTRFSVYFVNAPIDSIEENRIRNYNTYLNPVFTTQWMNGFQLQDKMIYEN